MQPRVLVLRWLGPMSLARTRLAIFLVALVFEIVASVAYASRADCALSELAVFFDGHIYMQIAKSFPLPYDEMGRDYLGHAAGYPFWIALVELLTPSAWVDWGMAALLVNWLAGAGCAVVFFDLCRVVGAPPIAGAALFVVANPRWIISATTAHAETVAMFFLLLSLLAYLEDRLPRCVATLSLAALARFPAILFGLPLAIGFLLLRRQWRLRTFAWLSLPLVVFALYNAYLYWRIPAFEGISEAHKVFWQPWIAMPFTDLLELARKPQRGPTFLYRMTFTTVAVYCLSIVFGLFDRVRERLVLPTWILVTVLFHVSLDSVESLGAIDFPRLAILAWPAVLLVMWRPLGPRLPVAWRAALCAAFAAVMIWPGLWMVESAVRAMKSKPHIAQELQLLETDQPLWYDFRKKTRRVPVGSAVPWASPEATR